MTGVAQPAARRRAATSARAAEAPAAARSARPLLVVSQFYAEETGTGHSLTKIAEGLGAYYPTRVICGQPTYVDQTRRAPQRERRNGVDVERARATRYSAHSLWRKVLNMATISVDIFWRTLVRTERGGTVLVVNLPPLLPILVVAAARLRGVRPLLLIHDVYPDSLAIAGVMRRGTLAYRAMDRLFASVYRAADRVIVLGRDMRDLIAEKSRIPAAEIDVIPNSAQLDEVRPVPRGESRLLATLGLTDKFVVKYAGHMGRTHGVECVAEAATLLRDDPDIHVLCIGAGPKKPWLEETVRERGLTNVTVLPFLPRAEIEDSVGACDVGVIALSPGLVGTSVPGRIYDLLAAGRPMIAVADERTELALVVREEEIGWVVPPDDAVALAAAVREAKRQRGALGEMGRRARRAVERSYSAEAQVERFVDVIEARAAARGA